MFRSRRNTVERTGTNCVPACSGNVPAAPVYQNTAVGQQPRGLQRFLRETMFRHVPVVPEHFEKAGGRVNQGFQKTPLAMFRMFRTKRGAPQVFRHTAFRGEATMQVDQSTIDFQLALDEFRQFADQRIDSSKMKLDGQTFVHTGVQLAFEAFQAGRDPSPRPGQLFASIREDSKYHSQIAWCISNGIGHPFPVRFLASRDAYVLKGGAGGLYRLADVDLLVLHEGQLYPVTVPSRGEAHE